MSKTKKLNDNDINIVKQTKLWIANGDYHYFDANNEQKALEAIKYLSNQSHIGFDTETTGLNPANLNERLRLVQFARRGKSYIFDIWRVSDLVKQSIKQLLESNEVVKIAHNALFDIKFVRADLNVKRFGKVYCTQRAEELLSFGNIAYGFSLADLVDRYFGIWLDKSQRLSDWSKPVLADEQLAYGSKDALVLESIREFQIQELKQYNLINLAKIEFEASEPVASMELNGIYLNKDKWSVMDNKRRKDKLKLENELCDLLAPEKQMLFDDIRSINLDSKQEVKARLKALGIELPKSKDGKDTLAKDSLKNMVNPPKVIELLQEYNEAQTNISRYGVTWFDYISSTSKRIHSSYRPNGAKTGRYSDSAPPKQQIPKKNEVRNCFEAQDKNSEITAGDYSQIELRILADYVYQFTHLADEQVNNYETRLSKLDKDNPNDLADISSIEHILLCHKHSRDMIGAFERDEDFHQFTASQIFEIDFDKVTSEERNPSKNMNFLMVYGGGAWNLAQKMKIPIERANWIVSRFMKLIPLELRR